MPQTQPLHSLFFLEGSRRSLQAVKTLVRYSGIAFFVVSLEALIIYLFLRRHNTLHNLVRNILLLSNLVMFAVDLFTVYFFKFPFNPLMLEIAMMTNVREGGEFLSMYLTEPGFWVFVLAVLCGVLVLRGVYALCAKRKAVLMGLMLLGFILSAGITVREAKVHSDSFEATLTTAGSGISRLPFMLKNYYASQRAFNEMMASVPEEVRITRNDSSIPYVVLVLGESTNRNHMALYGYSLPTSPKLIERQREGRCYVFDDVVSPHSHTNAVLQKLFTFCNREAKNKWYTYTSLFEVLESAGYFTAWMSNQEHP